MGDDLRLEKPVGDFYIGGSNSVDGVLMDVDKSVGFYPTEVKATREQKPLKLKKPKMKSVSTFNPESKGVNCLLKVLEEPTEVEVTKKSGANLKFWETVCGDESGRVVLSLTEAQKDAVIKDKTVVIRNGAIKK